METQQRQWQELARILDKVDRQGLRGLQAEELIDLGRLYRRAAADLARARTAGLDPRQIQQLNGLVGRAYAHVYTTETRGAGSVAAFFTREFPQSVRRCLPFIGTAFAVFFVASLLGLLATYQNPHAPDALLGPGWGAVVESIAQRHTGTKDWLPGEERPLASSMIMTNNIYVSILAFTLGIFGCLGTLFLMFHNGLMMGAVAAGVDQRGVGLGFWAFVAPHGSLELPAIFIAGGAGLLLGYALINPGELSRRIALQQAGGEAVKLILGVAAMLVVAGIIEGFFSPALLPESLKFTLAIALEIALVAYLGLAGRDDGQAPSSKLQAPSSEPGAWSLELGATHFTPFPPL
jgi:uncharacterized membrane protein SpoIIM required for sporulation